MHHPHLDIKRYVELMHSARATRYAYTKVDTTLARKRCPPVSLLVLKGGHPITEGLVSGDGCGCNLLQCVPVGRLCDGVSPALLLPYTAQSCRRGIQVGRMERRQLLHVRLNTTQDASLSVLFLSGICRLSVGRHREGQCPLGGTG